MIAAEVGDEARRERGRNEVIRDLLRQARADGKVVESDREQD
jgi:hypothetical protein